MSIIRTATLFAVVTLACAASAAAQSESKLGAELRKEHERLGEKCSAFAIKKVMDCAVTIVTDHPFHMAIGSLAPGNGFGFGLAFVSPQSKPNNDWRINWSADAVGTPSGAWRAGVYAKFVNTRVDAPGLARPGGGTASSDAMPRPYPTITLYGQATSLPKLAYYGIGNDTVQTARAAYQMRQSTIGTRVFWPLGRSGFLNRLNPIAIGDLNGRWVDVRGSSDTSDPSIDLLYRDASAPGLARHPATLQVGEALRVAPAIGRLQLIYTGQLQQFVASNPRNPIEILPAGTTLDPRTSSSFRRWTLDLRHELSLWTTSTERGERENNSPNECATAGTRTNGDYGCPDPFRVTTNRVGTLGFRALISRSAVSDDARVPFYFQRTLGGADVDGERLLASYDDYRFRAPNVLLLQETFEHVIWGPIGAWLALEQGRVAAQDDSLTDGTLKKTFGAGVTLRAGGVPMMTVWWAHGGSEGDHIAATMSMSLFGGSSRPSLR